MSRQKNLMNYAYKSKSIFLKSAKRRKKKQTKRAGEQRHALNIKRHAEKKGKSYIRSRKSNRFKNPIGPKPELPPNIKFLASVPELFSKNQYNKRDHGPFYIPECFSLIDNYQESFVFLKRLFAALYEGNIERLILDYGKCKRIDVDASICMDIMLAEFISYLRKCHSVRHIVYPLSIKPINFQKPEIMKVLFSIGAYRNIKGLQIKYTDIEALPVLINSQDFPNIWEKSEVHLTQIVEYIKRCLKRSGKDLTIESETKFYKVIGEVMSNAEEHSTMPHRFAIGFFQEIHNSEEDFGIFNFSIFNFGETIYETFKSPNCKNPKVVKQMSDLSVDYTKNGWFRKADFEEETLWTLYALQEGVTSKEKKRGNGSIQYIENFFNLKGSMDKDNTSKLVLLSGSTRIMFDGTYTITEKTKVGEKRKYKMITFNESGEIADEPDKKYVTFAPHYFPGTLISARILIKFDNTKSPTNESENI